MNRFLALLLLAALIPQPAQAIPITTFLQRPENEQHAYAAGAASMLAFTEGMAERAARANCITGWYRDKGQDQLYAALVLGPAAFKARFGFDREGNNGHVEMVMIRLANEACPK